MVKLDNLSRQITAPQRLHTIAPVKAQGDIWKAIEPYRESRETAGLIRLALRVLLGLTGEMDLESAADYLLVSCASQEDAVKLTRQVMELSVALGERLGLIESDDAG